MTIRVNLIRAAVLAGVLFPVAGAMAAVAEDDSLALCDSLYVAMDVRGSTVVARSLLEREPANHEAAWRLSRSLISAGNLAADENRSRRDFEEARNMARLAIELDPQGSVGYTCLAVCEGRLSRFEKGGDRIALADKARAAALKAVELDDRNDLAHLVLGVWNREIATVGGLTKLAAKVFYGGVPEGASLEKSEFHLRRAAALAPDFLNHRRELAITLMAMKRWEEAVAELEVAVGLGWKQPQDPIYAEEALELLEEARLELEETRSRHW